jgi:hypothetical protein
VRFVGVGDDVDDPDGPDGFSGSVSLSIGVILMPSDGTGGVANVLVEFLNAFIDAVACLEIAEICLALG